MNFWKEKYNGTLLYCLSFPTFNIFPPVMFPVPWKMKATWFSVTFSLQRALLPTAGSRGLGHVSLFCHVVMLCMLFKSIGLSTRMGPRHLGDGKEVFHCFCGRQTFWLLPLQLLNFREKEMWGSETNFKQTSFFLHLGWVFEDQQLQLHCHFNVIAKQ